MTRNDTATSHDTTPDRHAAAGQGAATERHAAAGQDAATEHRAGADRSAVTKQDAAPKRDAAAQREAVTGRDTAARQAAFPPEPGAGAIYVGQADLDAPGEQGWLLGHFRPADDPRHSAAVEIKWGRHPQGDRRAKWVTGEQRTALLVLIKGRFHMEFPDRTVVLTEPGDYVVWGRGVDHSWLAEEEDTVVLTVRWPSVAGYKVPPPE